MNARTLGLLVFALVLWTVPTKAGSYYGYSTINTFISIEDSSTSSFSIIAGTNERPTGNASGNASFSNNVTSGLDNSLPPPLFPGVYNSSRTSGSAGLPAGSSSSSSITIESESFLFFTRPTLLAFDVVTSTTTSVQTTAPDEYAVSFADASVYFDGTQIYSTSSTAGSFGNDYSYTTTSGGASPIMYVYAHAGVNELDSVSYANGYAYTVSLLSPPPSPAPEPSSIVLLLSGALVTGLHLRFRRRGQRAYPSSLQATL